ncbi:alpha-hydroxy-acid oxidizing protein [Actinokineospora soli]|uniref:Alpha-hydroxy-acid oxidizing protein n=1 Tax=Actinokineospora soli TaxID=1048753 RepID=A0ABW2TNY9_9PSEU
MIADRKDDHVRLALDQQRGPRERTEFDDVSFVHHALAGIDRAEVSLETGFAGVRWAVPLYINAMTGGSPMTGEINRGLAVAARETGVPIATGSMSAYFKDPRRRRRSRWCARRTPTGSSWPTSTPTPPSSAPGRRSTCCAPTRCRSTSTRSRRP